MSTKFRLASSHGLVVYVSGQLDHRWDKWSKLQKMAQTTHTNQTHLDISANIWSSNRYYSGTVAHSILLQKMDCVQINEIDHPWGKWNLVSCNL